MQAEYGFIGLGIMGAPMAANLARAASVLAFDTQEARFKAASGTSPAASVQAVAGACDVVFLSLPSSEIVRSVVIGAEGLIHALSSGATVIDTSTTDPKVSREIAAELERKGIGFLDAPVSSGGVAKLVNNMIVGAAFSGTEGTYLFDLREENVDLWKPQSLFDYEISEICTVDLDGDGREELVAIEPFDGNLMRVYKRGGKTVAGDTFEVIAEEELSCGHGLWCGDFNNVPSILVGNRTGDRTLKLYRATEDDGSSLSERVIDRDSGPANIAVVSCASGDVVFTTNQNSKEIALYESKLA